MIGWLWDMKITEKQAKKILSDPEDKDFIPLAAVLLARNNSPRVVMTKYLSPEDFCRHWAKIKKQMRKDSWNNPRITFWQAIYENAREKLREKGLKIRPASEKKKINGFFKTVGLQIKTLRKERDMTQKELAKKMGVSQQMISRVESGRFNVSLGILEKVVDRLGGQIKLEISEV